MPLMPRAFPALALFEDPVGVLVLLVGAEVPLADDADDDVDLVAPDVDELDDDLVLEVVEPAAIVLVPDEEVLVLDEAVLVSDEEEVGEETVELEVVAVRKDGEELVDWTESEPATVMLSL